ncbi:hydrolase, UxaA family [Cellvibrio sp. BR]|uniref:UxaA family hydrolase n=1 Tax=Cellvibrio sp. BR TaxID=1134474 RepID=UPI0002600999|nr:UxaA family hydrolase [Cellvibrio sp. BR]EIK43109.1 hydrolase, UxaA family [Cellvibrio sp. BR]
MTQNRSVTGESVGSLSPVILLHPNDNILVCVKQIHTGDELIIDGEKISAASDIAVGHKIARNNLVEAEKVYRYGAPIGSMVTAAVKGEHIHMHNMKSDYIPSHTRSRQNKDRSES